LIRKQPDIDFYQLSLNELRGNSGNSELLFVDDLKQHQLNKNDGGARCHAE